MTNMAGAKKRKLGPHALTANRLRDGDVVYLDRGGAWTGTFEFAYIYESPEEQDAALVAANADVEGRLVLDPYLFPVMKDGDHVRPTEQRELIRAKGPTIRLDLGKQAHVGV